MKAKLYVLLFLSIFFLQNPTTAQFQEVSKGINIDQIHLTVRSLGGGATFFDFNNDGFLDLYVTGGGNTDKLYMNLGDGRFHDVTIESGIADITDKYQTTTVISGDVDNDGCSDLFVTTHEGRRNLLLISRCDGTFQVRSFQSGLTEEAMSMGAAFLDFNNDGLLDIYVVNYVLTSRFIEDDQGEIIGFDHECWPNYFYINQGDGQFVEMSEELLINDAGCGLAVTTTDINSDGKTDLYIANDFGEWVIPNSAYINDYENNSFIDISSSSQLNIGLYGMGIANGDFDNDMDIDYYVTNMGNNQLMENDGTGTFTDVALEKGVQNGQTEDGSSTTGWGAMFFDYDNDSDLDLFVANGFIGAVEFLNPAENDPNKLYENIDGSFVDVTEEYNMDLEYRNRGVIYGDYDNDGDLDIFVVTLNGVDSLFSPFYENVIENDNNWIDFQLEGTTVNRDAIGAVVTIYFDNQQRIHEVVSGSSHASQSSLIAHFGLKDATAVDSAKVVWGPGIESTYYALPVNQKLFLKEGEALAGVMGCMDPDNEYYNSEATVNTGCKIRYIIGCMDPDALNYNANANLESNNCTYEEIVTGIEDELSRIAVYPNPFQEYLTIEVGNPEKYSVKIINLLGAEIVRKTDLPASKIVSTAALSGGVYLLILEDKTTKKREVRKLLKTE